MAAITLSLVVHVPPAIRRDYSFFDIGNDHKYWNDAATRMSVVRLAEKCLLPGNRLLLDMCKEYKGDFKLALSISGTAFELLRKYRPAVISGFKALADTGCVEFLNQPYWHSLSCLHSREEFVRQVTEHGRMINKLFGQKPTTFINTELIYSNDIAMIVEELGFKAMLIEGADSVLGWRTPNYIYQPVTCRNLRLLVRNSRLSDDIGVRFSDAQWVGYPLTAEKFGGWLQGVNTTGELINLVMNYEALGQTNAPDSGIFEFMRAMPRAVIAGGNMQFLFPAELARRYNPNAQLNAPRCVSWGSDGDVSLWHGNAMQESALELLYSMEKQVREVGDKGMQETWNHLQACDHLALMATRAVPDRVLMRVQNDFESAYFAHITYMNILADLAERLETASPPRGRRRPPA